MNYAAFFRQIPAFLLTALCAVAMLTQTRWVLHLPARADALVGYVFFAALFAYNFLSAYRWMRVIGWLCAPFAGILWLYLPAPAQWAAVLSGLVWLLYYGPPRLIPGAAGLRFSIFLKPFSVAAAWAMMTVILPIMVNHDTTEPLGTSVWLLFVERACFIMALALAYDLHDAAADRLVAMPTWASRRTSGQVFTLMNCLLWLSFLCAAGNVILLLYSWCDLFLLGLSLWSAGLALRLMFDVPDIHDLRKMGIDALMLWQFLCLSSN
jgi:hypothetical protein